LKDYIERANRAGHIDFTYTTKTDVFNKLNLTEESKLKNAAYILFAASPMLEVQMAIFAGTERLTPQDFIDGYERSIKRNPLLAQLMYYSKDIESFGTGLKRITTACDKVGVRV